VEFRLLGPLEVLGDDGEPVALGGPRPRALLTLLLLHPNEVVSVDRLIDGVWGEAPPASAQNALQVHVYALRGALGSDRIVTRPPGYLVAVEDGELDVERFERLVGDGRAREALALWRGPALADVAYEPFAQAEAARLEERRLGALEARIDADLDGGDHAALAPELEALVAAHPHRERLRALQMLALYRSGRQADALAAYRDARAALDELGLEPSAGLRGLEQRILRQDPDLETTVERAVPVRELPAPAGTLIGRALEHAAVTALLDRDDTRLVTLTGPGGTGKTRLALAVARTLADGGLPVTFVDLSAVHDPALVLPTVTRALAASEEPGADALATAVSALGHEPCLLVLDNLEQVIDAAGDVASLLDSAPAARMLATSRGPLRVAHEHEYRVPPLAVPEPGGAARELARNPSVSLYVERAAAALPTFALTDENAEAVGRICRALDGLPLALELAAARIRSLGPEGTAARVGERLSLLSRGARDLPERQRSLRATIDWSAELLELDARRVLAAVSVFSGGAAFEAVEFVVGNGTDVPGALDDLLDAALVTHAADDAGAPRFGMLETVREYAAELLATSDDERNVRDRHLEWLLRLAEQEGPYWQRPVDAPWLERIEVEHDNIRGAFAHARATGDVERELRLANALRYFWRVRGYVEEGRRRLEEAVALSDGVEPALRARTLGEAGVMAFAAGDYGRARELWSEAIPLLEEIGDQRELGRARGELGATWHAEGDLDAAVPYYEASGEALAQSDDVASQAIVLANLAAIHQTRGEHARAREVGLAALALQEQMDDTEGIGVTSLNLAAGALESGDLLVAVDHLEVGYARLVAIGFREQSAYAYGVTAQLALALDRPEDAATLLGAFAEQFRIVGSPPQSEEGERYDRLLARVSELVDVDAALERGAALTQEELDALVASVVAAARS
jgi:predicted ATPase/DNA-binding SARP family transcriptional activator